MTKKKKASVLIIYIIAFYTLWAVFEIAVKSMLNNIITNDILCQFIKSGIIKNLIWTLPAILLVKNFMTEVYIPLNEMFSKKVNWLKYLPIFILFTVYILAGVFLTKGNLVLSDDFRIDDIIIVLFVGLTEEMVFRGWLLNATINEKKKWLYIIINAVMFLAIHFPNWIYNGIFISSFASFSFLSVMILSVIFSWTFIKSRNILVPITLHMYWDLLMFMFY